MPFRRAASTVALLFALTGVAAAHDYTAGSLFVGHPWSRATAPGAKVGGGFLSVRNDGQEPDRLVKVSVPFAARAEIHESLEEDGVARMRPVEGGVAIRPGETVTLRPGGKHLMFVGLAEALRKGDTVKGELTFEKAGKIEVEFAVEAPGAKPEKPVDHSKHGL